jgi:hypothetical protein
VFSLTVTAYPWTITTTNGLNLRKCLESTTRHTELWTDSPAYESLDEYVFIEVRITLLRLITYCSELSSHHLKQLVGLNTRHLLSQDFMQRTRLIHWAVG